MAYLACLIVRLARNCSKESKDRVRSAILNSGYDFAPRRITINLRLPIYQRRWSLDLPIALGILIASEQLHIPHIANYEFAGELALSGDLRSIKGALPFAIATRRAQRELIIAADNAFEAAMPQDNTVYAAHTLLEVCKHINWQRIITKIRIRHSIKS